MMGACYLPKLLVNGATLVAPFEGDALMTDRIFDFLAERRREGRDNGPCLVVDLDVVRDNYLGFARALPDTRVFMPLKQTLRLKFCRFWLL